MCLTSKFGEKYPVYGCQYTGLILVKNRVLVSSEGGPSQFSNRPGHSFNVHLINTETTLRTSMVYIRVHQSFSDMNPVGVLAFGVTITMCTALINFNNYFGSSTTASTITSENLASIKNEEQGNIRRNDSEFSLGLSRSVSINRELSEFGKLCDSGQIFITVSSIGIRMALGSFIVYKIYDTVTNKK